MEANPLVQNRIIVLDDDADSRELFARFLRSRGFRVDEFEAAEEALDSMGADMPAVIVMDITLATNVDGYEAARRIRAMPAASAVRLIAMTGYSSASVKKEGPLFDAILTKPIDAIQLVDLVLRLCSSRD